MKNQLGQNPDVIPLDTIRKKKREEARTKELFDLGLREARLRIHMEGLAGEEKQKKIDIINEIIEKRRIILAELESLRVIPGNMFEVLRELIKKELELEGLEDGLVQLEEEKKQLSLGEEDPELGDIIRIGGQGVLNGRIREKKSEIMMVKRRIDVLEDERVRLLSPEEKRAEIEVLESDIEILDKEIQAMVTKKEDYSQNMPELDLIDNDIKKHNEEIMELRKRLKVLKKFD